MKVQIFFGGLLSFVTLSAFAQQTQFPRRNQDVNPDPFDIVRMYAHQRDTAVPEQRKNNANGTTITLQQLQHKISKAALKEYKKGRDAFAKSDNQAAKEHLQKAVNLDPEFVDAHNDLGVVLGKLKDLDNAVLELQKAIALAPDYGRAMANLSFVFYAMGRYHDVSLLARRTLRIDPTLVHVRYILALSLIAEHGDKKETLENLARSAGEFPEAHVAASNVLAKAGRRDEAAAQLEQFLSSVPKENASRQQVEERLAELRR